MIFSKHHILIPLVFIYFKSTAQEANGTSGDEKNAQELSEIFISPLHTSNTALNTPASVGILNKTDLVRNNTTDITSVINTLPGVYMQSSNLTTTRISIRGIGARTPYGTNKIRAFYGHIPLTFGNNETVIDDIDLQNLDQIEIIKGPLSSVYGAGLGGAILISPTMPKSGEHFVKTNTTIGSFRTIKNTLNYSLDTKENSINMSYHHLQTDGWRENSAYERQGMTISGELFRKEQRKLTYFSNITSLFGYIPSSIDKLTFESKPRSSAPTWLASKGYKEYKTTFTGLAHEFNFAENLKNTTAIFLNYKDSNEPRPFDILRQYTFATGARTQFSGSIPIGNTNHYLTAGLEFFTDTYAANTFENLYKENNGLGSLQGKTLNRSGQDRTFYNIFSQLRSILSEQVELQLGLNYNKTTFKMTSPNTGTSQRHSYYGIMSPQASIIYKSSAQQTFYVAISRGFSLPSNEETLKTDGTINHEIKPETGYNLEVGGKFYALSRKLYAEIALYSMDIKNLLVAKRIGDDQYLGLNAGKTQHQGIEMLLKHQQHLTEHTTMTSSLGLTLGRYRFRQFEDDGQDFKGNAVTGVPSSSLIMGLSLESHLKLYLSTDYQFVDKLPMNDANTQYAAAYHLLNVKAGYKFKIRSMLESNVAVGVNNLTDTSYASMILVNAVGAGNSAPRYYYPGLPIHYYGSLALKYLF